MRGHRERKRLYLLACIDVTALVFHFDTSLLNTDALLNTAKDRVNNESKNTTTNINTKKYGSTDKTREREYTYCHTYLSPHPCSILTSPG